MASVLIVFGCETRSSTDKTVRIDAPAPLSAVQPELASTDGPVIVRLVGRDSTIIARAGAGGSSPTYTFTDAHGNVISDDRTLEYLRAQHPQLFEQIDSAIADVPVDYLDAGLGPFE